MTGSVNYDINRTNFQGGANLVLRAMRGGTCALQQNVICGWVCHTQVKTERDSTNRSGKDSRSRVHFVLLCVFQLPIRSVLLLSSSAAKIHTPLA